MQRGAEAEADQHGGGAVLEDEHDRRRADEAEADTEQAGDPPGAEGDLERRWQLSLAGRGRRADVAANRQAHADEPRHPGEDRAAEEGDRTGKAGLHERQRHRPVRTDDLGGGEEHEHEQRDDDDGDRLELAAQESVGAFLDGGRDLAHLVGAGVGGEHAAHQVEGRRDRHHARQEREHEPDPLGPAEHEGLIAAGREEMGRHYLLLWSGRVGSEYGRRRADTNCAIARTVTRGCQALLLAAPPRPAPIGINRWAVALRRTEASRCDRPRLHRGRGLLAKASQRARGSR